jgi:hypothetical protein
MDRQAMKGMSATALPLVCDDEFGIASAEE